jgi:xylan 1,4-beta-xylosidase
MTKSRLGTESVGKRRAAGVETLTKALVGSGRRKNMGSGPLRKKVQAIIVSAVLVTMAPALQNPRTPVSDGKAQTITIDASAGTHPFPHFWEQMFGSGRAILSLRESYRHDLRLVKDVTGFGYIRFHAIFHDEVGVYDRDPQGKTLYNFSYVDQIYDGLLANGVRPFVEISFMPRLLAANPVPHAFWYKPYPSPPNDPQEWARLIGAFTRHLVERYGAEEVETWYFEVWNEPNIDFWTGEPKKETYFSFYKLTANAIRQVDSKIRLGGPSTAQAAWVSDFIAYCTQESVPFDFVSTHIYGNEDPVNVFGTAAAVSRKDMVARAVRKVHEEVAKSAAPKTPVLITEYNATYLNQTEVTDGPFMGPWLANTIRECDGLTPMMSYWTFSDVFEEQGVVKMPFYGGYGIVAERGIPKAAYRAFELLNKLGDQRMENESPDVVVTKRRDGALVLALWNYAEPDERAEEKVFRLKVMNSGHKSYTLQVVDKEHGSALEGWNAMGKPPTPSVAQIAKLVEASKLGAPTRHPLTEPIRLKARALAVVVIR